MNNTLNDQRKKRETAISFVNEINASDIIDSITYSKAGLIDLTGVLFSDKQVHGDKKS